MKKSLYVLNCLAFHVKVTCEDCPIGALGISVEPRRKPVPTKELRPDEDAPVNKMKKLYFINSNSFKRYSHDPNFMPVWVST